MNFQPVRFLNGLNITEGHVLANIKANCANKNVPRIAVKKVVICGGGPSLADHIVAIRAKQSRGFHVYALNGAAAFLKSHGIQPNAVVMVDARPQNIEFVTPADPEITYFVGSGCDPAVFDALQGQKVHMMHIAAVDGAVDMIAELNPGCSILMSASTVGLQALNLMHVLGYRIVHLYGYDSSNRSGAHHAYAQPLNDEQALREFQFQGKSYSASGPMASQAEQFAINYRKWTSQGMDLQVFGDGLLPDMWRFHEAISAHGSLEDRESIKYQRMWSIPDYRKHSPGEKLVASFIDSCEVGPRARIIDFGCGSGRATKMLVECGYDVLGIDFAHNCLDDGADVPFICANLWSLPPDIKPADWGYCCDVLEHIPPEKVDDVIASIADLVMTGAFFNISFRRDDFGTCIGETLHLTVRPQQWWCDQLNNHFSKVDYIADGIFICRK